MSCVLQFDGGAVPNPGRGGSGCVLSVDGACAYRGSLAHPAPCTNNEAEYGGLLLGLRALQRLPVRVSELRVQGDSELVIKQCTGAYACEAANLRPLLQEVARLLAAPPLSGARVTFEHIPRDQNAEADALASAGVSGGTEDHFVGSSSASGGGGGGAGAMVASSHGAGGAAAVQPHEEGEAEEGEQEMELTAEEAAEMDKFMRETFTVNPEWPADQPHPGALTTRFFYITHWKWKVWENFAEELKSGEKRATDFFKRSIVSLLFGKGHMEGCGCVCTCDDAARESRDRYRYYAVAVGREPGVCECAARAEARAQARAPWPPPALPAPLTPPPGTRPLLCRLVRSRGTGAGAGVSWRAPQGLSSALPRKRVRARGAG